MNSQTNRLIVGSMQARGDRGKGFEEVDAAEGETDVLSDALKENYTGGFAKADDDDNDDNDNDDDDGNNDDGDNNENDYESDNDDNDDDDDDEEEEEESESAYVLAEFPDLDGHDVFSLDSTKTVRLHNLFGTDGTDPICMIDDMVFRGSHLASIGTNLLLRTGAGSGGSLSTAGTSLGVHGRVIEFKLKDYIAPSALPGPQVFDNDSNNEYNNEIMAARKRKYETDQGSSLDKARARSIELNHAGGVVVVGGDGSESVRTEDYDSGVAAMCKDGQTVNDDVEVDGGGEYGDDKYNNYVVSPASEEALVNRNNSSYNADVHLLSKSNENEYSPVLDKSKQVSFMKPVDSNSSSLNINAPSA